MLIGNVLEKTTTESAWQICADKLADHVRNIWLEQTNTGSKRWEDAFSEDPAALPGLREEGIHNLAGLDYIMKWWGGEDSDSLAGEIDVIWKIAEEHGGIACYRTWIKLAERDFTFPLYTEESEKRRENRKNFRAAFTQWNTLFS